MANARSCRVAKRRFVRDSACREEVVGEIQRPTSLANFARPCHARSEFTQTAARCKSKTGLVNTYSVSAEKAYPF